VNLSETEEYIHNKKLKVIESVQKLKQEHPVLTEIVKKAIPFLPSPFDKISQAIYDSFEGSKADKVNEVLKFLDRIENQTNEYYQFITSGLSDALAEISQLNTIVAKDSTVIEIIGILGDSSDGKTIHEKLDSLKRNIEQTKYLYQKLTSIHYESYGLSWLSPDYFEINRSTDKDIRDWKTGFSFKLSAIKSRYEFRRDKVIEVIKDNLERNNLQIILGPSGFSKSTILMEIMCDYFDNGYQILYNLADPDIKNGEQIVKFIQNEILNCGYKALIVVDDAHTKRSATIFYVIDNLLSYHQPKTIKFLLTARIPEFYNSFLEEENLSELIQDQESRKAIRKITQNKHFRYELPPFEPDEIKGFTLKYEQASSRENESIENEARRLHEETRGILLWSSSL
jgi:hypothetical protein